MKFFMIVTLALTLVSASFSGVFALQESDFRYFTLPIHEPIHIQSEADYTPDNGIIGGSGTEMDPFVIAGWTILAPFNSAITIENTDSHVLIADNHLKLAYLHMVSSAGIRIFEASNVTIENNIIESSQNGVQVFYSSNVSVNSNIISGLQTGTGAVIVSLFGIGTIDARELQIANNQISYFGWGVKIEGDQSRYITISENEIHNVSQTNIEVRDQSENIVIAENSIRDSSKAFTINGKDVRVTQNTIVNVNRDFDVFESTDVLISYNTVDQVFSESIYYQCDNCYVFQNEFEGMMEGFVVNDHVVFTRNTFLNNDVVIGNNTDERAIFRENIFDTSNEVFAIANGVTLNLTYNWWGDEEGPDPDKFETMNGGEVIVEPWLTSPPM